MKICSARFLALMTLLSLFLFMDVPVMKAAAKHSLSGNSPQNLQNANSDRILNIYMRTSEEDGNLPLQNIILDIYKVATQGQLASGEVVLPSAPADVEIAQYKTRNNLAATLMTDAQGLAALNFSQAGLPDGVYLITEQYNPATASVMNPLFLSVPGIENDGGSIQNLYLENIPEKAPDVRMDVTEKNQESDSFDIGQVHTWIIRSDIPAGIGTAKQYAITDALDYRLTYEKGSPVVTLYTREGTEKILDRNTHYELMEGNTAGSEQITDRFVISLTAEGMSYIAANLGSGKYKPEIGVCFQAAINQNTEMGATIPNDAHLDYTNSAGIDYDVDSDIPEVHTGGIHILKTDRDNLPVANATFMIAREATQAEMEDETLAKEVLDIGSKFLAVVYVYFYSADIHGRKSDTVTTGEDGKASIYGLSYGTYYLVEIPTSENSHQTAPPISVTINESSHLTEEDGWMDIHDNIVDNTLQIGTAKFTLPYTGGMGTTVFTWLGITTICAACILLLGNRNRKI